MGFESRAEQAFSGRASAVCHGDNCPSQQWLPNNDLQRLAGLGEGWDVGRVCDQPPQATIVFGTTLAGSGVDGSNGVGVWSGTSDGPRLIARKGDPAPGTPAGVSFGWSQVDEFVPTLNDAGQVAFLAALTGPGVSSASDRGIWATGPPGKLELVIREGDMLEVGPGLFRTVAGLCFASTTQDAFLPPVSTTWVNWRFGLPLGAVRAGSLSPRSLSPPRSRSWPLAGWPWCGDALGGDEGACRHAFCQLFSGKESAGRGLTDVPRSERIPSAATMVG